MPQHGDREQLRFVTDFPEPTPGADELLIRVHATSLNQVDLVVRRGYPGIGIPLPHIMGGDIAGEVVARGAAVTSPPLGARVVAYPIVSCGDCPLCREGRPNLCLNWRYFGLHLKGGYAEFAVVPAANALPLPDSLAYESAAALPVAGLTAWHALTSVGELRAGQTFFIWGGTGGMGSIAIQIAKQLGATVIATGGTAEKLDRMRSLGADYALNRFSDDIPARVREIAPNGVDLVMNYVGPQTFPASFEMLKKGGTMLLCGIITGRETAVSLHQSYLRHLNLKGLYLGTQQELQELLNLVASGAVRPYIDSVLRLDEAPEAHRRLESGEFFGKIILKV